jgi:hypothetical protein
MPVKRRTTKKRSRRGGSLKAWAMKGHKFMRSKNLYSKGLSAAYNRFGKPLVSRKAGKHAGMVNKGVEMALSKLRQSGYGCGSGLRRTGMGLRLAGGSNRLKY